MTGCLAVEFLHDIGQFGFGGDFIADADSVKEFPVVAAEEGMHAGQAAG